MTIDLTPNSDFRFYLGLYTLIIIFGIAYIRTRK